MGMKDGHKSLFERGLEHFNQMDAGKLMDELLWVTGSDDLANELVEARPFTSMAALIGRLDRGWHTLDHKQLAGAICSNHELADEHAGKEEECSAATRRGSPAVIQAMKEANEKYKEKFGFIFFIFALNLDLEFMLGALEYRIKNEPKVEIEIARQEKRLLSRYRLQRLFNERWSGDIVVHG